MAESHKLHSSWLSWVKYLLFSLIPLTILLASSEVVLRISNFRYSDTPLLILSEPEKVANTSFSKKAITLIKDKYQFWMSLPTFDQRYGSEKEKPVGVTRIVALGCSCTQMCAYSTRSYPDLMEDILNSQFPFGYRVLNAAEGSYSSFQGLQRLRRVVAKYNPDIITIFFGWNDHWVAMVPDHLVKVKADWQIDLINFFEKFKIYQAYHWVIANIKGKLLKWKNPNARANYRVPPEEYEKNLNAMIDFCKEQNIRFVLITAPFDPSQIKSFANFPFSKQALIETHMSYNKIVRKVGMSRQVPVIDLETFFLNSESKQISSYFSDGIHFTLTGCQLIAELIVKQMQELSILKSPSKPVK